MRIKGSVVLMERTLLTLAFAFSSTVLGGSMKIESPAFSPNHSIPKVYTGEGSDISPPLHFLNIPQGAKELALICEDPDAPTSEPFVHWVAYGIPRTVSYLPEGVPAKSTLDAPIHLVQGINSFDRIGYRGPMPPRHHGTHHYHFKLYALDSPLKIKPGATKDELLAAMKGHTLGEAELVGTFKRD